MCEILCNYIIRVTHVDEYIAKPNMKRSPMRSKMCHACVFATRHECPTRFLLYD